MGENTWPTAGSLRPRLQSVRGSGGGCSILPALTLSPLTGRAPGAGEGAAGLFLAPLFLLASGWGMVRTEEGGWAPSLHRGGAVGGPPECNPFFYSALSSQMKQLLFLSLEGGKARTGS